MKLEASNDARSLALTLALAFSLEAQNQKFEQNIAGARISELQATNQDLTQTIEWLWDEVAREKDRYYEQHEENSQLKVGIQMLQLKSSLTGHGLPRPEQPSSQWQAGISFHENFTYVHLLIFIWCDR